LSRARLNQTNRTQKTETKIKTKEKICTQTSQNEGTKKCNITKIKKTTQDINRHQHNTVVGGQAMGELKKR